MSQYIGAIAFAKGLDRTLVLPPFIKYPPMVAGSVSHQLYCINVNVCTIGVYYNNMLMYVLLEYITITCVGYCRKEYLSLTILI